MRIAITADPYIPVPPKFYGGIERVLALLVDGLVANGHDVVLLGHPESNTEARLVPYGAPPHTGRVDRTRELFQVGTWLWRHSHELDVVHSFGRLAALLPILPADSARQDSKLPARDTLGRRSPRRQARTAITEFHRLLDGHVQELYSRRMAHRLQLCRRRPF